LNENLTIVLFIFNFIIFSLKRYIYYLKKHVNIVNLVKGFSLFIFAFILKAVLYGLFSHISLGDSFGLGIYTWLAKLFIYPAVDLIKDFLLTNNLMFSMNATPGGSNTTGGGGNSATGTSLATANAPNYPLHTRQPGVQNIGNLGTVAYIPIGNGLTPSDLQVVDQNDQLVGGWRPAGSGTNQPLAGHLADVLESLRHSGQRSLSDTMIRSPQLRSFINDAYQQSTPEHREFIFNEIGITNRLISTLRNSR